jgi:putative Mg2+ transporter-C (MgtC) family protein
MIRGDLDLLARIAVGFVLAYTIGFERQLRGSPAGDRTYALVGAAATAITAVAGQTSPQTVAGVVTGIGFIGGALVFRGQGGLVRGLTSAATIFTAAALGIVVGYGHLVIGVVMTIGLLLTLELQHIPGLRKLDARNYSDHFEEDRPQPPDS